MSPLYATKADREVELFVKEEMERNGWKVQHHDAVHPWDLTATKPPLSRNLRQRVLLVEVKGRLDCDWGQPPVDESVFFEKKKADDLLAAFPARHAPGLVVSVMKDWLPRFAWITTTSLPRYKVGVMRRHVVRDPGDIEDPGYYISLIDFHPLSLL